MSLYIEEPNQQKSTNIISPDLMFVRYLATTITWYIHKPSSAIDGLNISLILEHQDNKLYCKSYMALDNNCKVTLIVPLCKMKIATTLPKDFETLKS